MKTAPTLLFFTAGSLSSAQLRFAGVSRFAAANGWMVQAVEGVGRQTPFEEIVRFWKPVGVILEYGEDLPRDAIRRFRRIPVVCLDRDPTWGGVCVCQDSFEAGAMVARELLRGGDRRSFGYVGFDPPKRWDEERRDGFVETLATNGRHASVFAASSGRAGESLRRVGAWLAKLPRPCAVMAATDGLAAKLLGVCAQLGLSVPDDVSLAGVDNALHICERSPVTLTSVEPDFEGSGFIAAELVARLAQGDRGGDRIVRFPERRLVRRASTTVLRRSDVAVRRTVEFIRTQASAGLRVADVVAVLGCSRRSAEMRFRAATGSGIFEAIDAQRIDCAKELLRRAGQAVGPIASLCGFGTEANFRRAFVQATGLSPRAWRAAQLVGSCARLAK